MHFLALVITKNGPDNYGYEKELEDALDPFYEGNCQPNKVYSKEEVDEIITDYSKKLSARNQYYTNTIYSCFYSCSNKNNILKSVSVKTL